MNETTKAPSLRWGYLALGVTALLFAGILYGWSILKAPLANTFGWSEPQLALNFTLTMCFFCLGGFLGGLANKRLGPRLPLLLTGGVSCAGFLMTAALDGGSVAMLYVSYGFLAGGGIGVAYNIIISTVSAWFPDKKGVCSGALMMGFGASALVVGGFASALIEGPGWRRCFTVLGLCLGAVLFLTGLLLRRPAAGTFFPRPVRDPSAGPGENFDPRDYPTGEMVRRPSFWQAFFCIVFLSAVGNTVISFARDLALSVGAPAALATSLVGVLSVCNGLGRIVTGALFDRLGRKRTMVLSNLLAIAAAGVTLAAVSAGSLPLCVAGLCATGFSYGAAPTISSAFTSAFYGSKYFPLNFSVMNFNLMGASLIATAAGALRASTGGYTAPFLLLLGLAVVSLGLDLSVKRP